MSAQKEHKLLIAGGKTGGHLFPGIAVAKKFLSLGEGRKVLFVGTSEGLEAKVLPREKLDVKFVRSVGIRGEGIIGALRGLLLIPVTLFQALRIILAFKPSVALGVGGFVSGPVIFIACLLRIPTAIQEQNVIPGITNRILGKLVDMVFVSFPESTRYFPSNKVMVTGNPVREEIISPTQQGESELRRELLEPAKLTVLVFGGSQGARAINRAMVDFMRSNPAVRDKINLIHQTGSADYQWVHDEYAQMGYKAIVMPFIYKMAEAYSVADLVVCRAGASTVFELLAAGKASVLIPYPYAVGDHQTYNAMALAEKGAAVMVKQSDIEKGVLSRTLKELIGDRERLKVMGEKARSLAKLDSAEVIARKLDELA